MHSPSATEFAALARTHTVIPVFRTLVADALTPVSAFRKLHTGDEWAFLFESVVGGERVGRYSILGADPFLLFAATGNLIEITERGGVGVKGHSPDPLKTLETLVNKFRGPHLPGLPRFCGGAVGFAGYDAVRYVEKLPNTPSDDRGIPDLCFGFYDEMVIFDHINKTVLVVAHAHTGGTGEADYTAACKRVDALVDKLAKPLADLAVKDITLDTRYPDPSGRYTSNFTRESWDAMIRKGIDYILAGDVFQYVPSQRFRTTTTADAFDIYRALRVINPSPFMFFLDVGNPKLVGASPEIMCRVENGEMTNRPLAGTRRRGATPVADKALAEELLADPKERAEHIMLVDLGRNDVGKVCELGSVKLAELMTVERYSHVMHISSTVTGKLKPGLTAFDALRSALPAGTLSGAPKVRAMEIIDELEPHKRGPYGGAVGYFDFSGNMDTCIALRTLVMQGQTADIQAGCGVVADSNPAAEYAETVNKAMGLMRAIEVAETQLK
ncbi:MAG: anthranilate synthase component I [Fimbriiglobus sp.]|nr:anthranilate synthase component I [Fimbriiglobus sp.]